MLCSMVSEMAGTLAGKLRSIDRDKHHPQMVPLIRIQEQAARARREAYQPDIIPKYRSHAVPPEFDPVADETLVGQLTAIAEELVAQGIE